MIEDAYVTFNNMSAPAIMARRFLITRFGGTRMFLHIGGGKYLRASEIIGFFDIETATQSGITKDFLKVAQDQGNTTSVCSDLPKSFVVTATKAKNKKVQQRLYISASAVKTLKSRSDF